MGNKKPDSIPVAAHRAENELPFVKLTDRVDFQLLQVDVEGGLRVLRTRFEPGNTVQQHRRTGQVYAVTYSGTGRYLEYPQINTIAS